MIGVPPEIKPDGEGHSTDTDSVDVVLVNMPFTSLNRPSLALGLLKGMLNEMGLRTRNLHFNMEMARRLDPSFYKEISDNQVMAMDYRIGDWMFSRWLFEGEDSGRNSGSTRAFLEEVVRPYLESLREDGKLGHSIERAFQRILEARDAVDPFLDHCAETILAREPSIVGFTSTFQQHLASLALARRLKQTAPDLTVLLGGGNCEHVMGAETVRRFPFVDAVVSGEADKVFPDMIRRIQNDEDLSGLQGVYTPDTVEDVFEKGCPSAPMVQNMDELPVPDYRDYFRQLTAHRLKRHLDRVILPVQTARGCWWGERSHCTFCGLNGTNMAYRSKSPDRALDELLFLEREYEHDCIHVVDNILDMKYLKELFPRLAQAEDRPRLSYEVFPTLKRHQIRQLSEGGVYFLLPGVESLSENVLSVMQKGQSMIQNVEFLKSCKEFGIRPQWNILHGFADEDPEDYRRMAELVPKFTHLPPPEGTNRIDLARFSPNFREPEEHGLTDVQPKPAYYHLYDLPEEAVENLAYHFDYEYRDHPPPSEYTDLLKNRVGEWRARRNQTDLVSLKLDNHVLIWDFRHQDEPQLTVLSSTTRTLYSACETARSTRHLTKWMEQEHGVDLDEDEIHRRFQPLVERDLMYREGKRYLNLAVPLRHYTPEPEVLEQLLSMVRKHGGRNGDGGYRIPLSQPDGKQEVHVVP